MSRRKTKEEVNTQLEEQGRPLRLVGEYLSALKKSLFRCENGHECMMRPNDILNGHGCAMCSGYYQTRESFNQKLESVGRTERMIGQYLGAVKKTMFRCGHGHEWMARPNDIDNERGCPDCADTRLSKETVNQRLSEQGRTVKLVGEYLNNYSKTTFECEVGHHWEIGTDNVLRGSGCPTCAKYGFDSSKPAHTYILRFDDFIKCGITNNLERRLEEHRRNGGQYTVIETRYYEVGTDARQWELNIKRTHGGNHVTKDRLSNGHTETLPLEKLAEIIQNT